MANNDTIKKTISVTLLLCIVCSVVVSTAAVLLRPIQETNEALNFKTNILAAADLLQEGEDVETVFEEKVTTRVVDLETGTFTDEVDPDNYDPLKAARDPNRSMNLSNNEDIAGISRRERYSIVYLVNNEQGNLDRIVLPVRGYGLWSTLYGFLALEENANTVIGLGFYDHGETPGLGGEIDNPRWKALWSGKEIYDESGDVAISVVKGSVDPSAPDAEHKVDGLSGATLTSRGVQNLLRFWLSEKGFKPFLANLQQGEA